MSQTAPLPTPPRRRPLTWLLGIGVFRGAWKVHVTPSSKLSSYDCDAEGDENEARTDIVRNARLRFLYRGIPALRMVMCLARGHLAQAAHPIVSLPPMGFFGVRGKFTHPLLANFHRMIAMLRAMKHIAHTDIVHNKCFV